VPFSKKKSPAKVSPADITIENLIFDQLVVDVKSTKTAQAYFLKSNDLKVFDIHVEKQDTLAPDIFGLLDFDVPEFKTVTHNSLYTFSAIGIKYSSTSNTFSVDSFAIHPNYSEYEFTARSRFETDRLEGDFSRISFFDFSAADFIKSGNVTSSLIKIGKADLHIFRDKRKEFRHVEKPTFQDLIYDYPGILNIDSVVLLSGNIVYSEHAEKATGKGIVRFNQIDATICKISNDTTYKTEPAYLKLNANALFMGKGKVAIVLESRIFDPRNTFTIEGRLSGMDASDLNPLLENIAYLTITSRKINEVNFSISANNSKATGHLNLLYEQLAFEIMPAQPGEAPAAVDQAKLMIANLIVLESNPMPGEKVRPGRIEYKRDPEKFLFGYFVKALLSGIKASATKAKSRKKSRR
jgi:hypothetical protein